MKEAGSSLAEISKREKVAIRSISDTFKKGPPEDRKRKLQKPNKALVKRRALVERLLTHRVSKEEDIKPTLNKNGQARANSRQPRVETRFPTGSLTRTRRALATQHGIVVSRSTVWRDKEKTGLKARRRPNGPERYRGDKERRLAHAKKTLPFARKNKAITVYVDEKMFDSMDSDVFMYCKNGEHPAPRERTRFPPRVHVFAAVGVGIKFLHVFEPGERVTAAVYREKCLKPLLKLLKTRFLLHDNAGPHTGVKDWLSDQKIMGVVDHPPRSPDMNPSERGWTSTVRAVSAAGPLTDAQLRDFVVKCWYAQSQKSIDNICNGWPRMLESVIAKKGETSCKNLPKKKKRKKK